MVGSAAPGIDLGAEPRKICVTRARGRIFFAYNYGKMLTMRSYGNPHGIINLMTPLRWIANIVIVQYAYTDTVDELRCS